MKDEQQLEQMRHSLSHIMAAAIQKLYPTTKFGIGPAIDQGFYYDIDLSDQTISETDFNKIEKAMRHIIKQNLLIEQKTMSVKEALRWAEETNQPYKTELINDLVAAGEVKDILEFYQIGNFLDLCCGPHVAKTSDVGPFKLQRIAGAYWRGDEKREQVQRLYAVAFQTQEELDEYLHQQEEAKKRDHRKLGKELDLFTFSPLVGAGLPMFTPRGTILRDKLTDYSLSLRARAGFEKIWTPHITKTDLFKVSGHWDKFSDELFLVKSQETSDEFAMKPMNCPHQIQIYASRPRTYRELPIRYMESTTDYRDEKTGELGGLSRVRALTQDDSHVFLRESQIKEEVGTLAKIVRELYDQLGMSKLRARLSYRDDSDGYLGERALWDKAQTQIKELAIENDLDYFEAEGEAAFYGPKIDFMARDAIGREFQVATIQIDFFMAGRFGLEFTNEKGEKETPVMLHHATLGSIERFLSVFIEHTAGWFPFWCAPEQIRILTINDTISDYVGEISEILKDTTLAAPIRHNDIRFSIDSRNESIGKKIREATELKIPMQIIVGPKDVEAGEVSIRLQSGEQKIKLSDLRQFILDVKF